MDIRPYESDGFYVYELPVRIWHWTMAVAIGVLIVTGYIIGLPWHSLSGDPTYLFYMGYTRLAHFTAGYIVAAGMVFRVFYAFLGNKYARSIFCIPVWKKLWWKALINDFRWYLFLDRRPRIHMGHNPLAQLGMFSFILFTLLMCFTGLAIYQEEARAWYLEPFRLMVDFAYWTGGNTIDLHNWHRLGMKLVVGFIIVHLYMVWREEVMGKTTLISTMVSGFRQIRSGERG